MTYQQLVETILFEANAALLTRVGRGARSTGSRFKTMASRVLRNPDGTWAGSRGYGSNAGGAVVAERMRSKVRQWLKSSGGLREPIKMHPDAANKRLALDYDGIIADDNRAVLDYINRKVPHSKRVGLNQIGSYDPANPQQLKKEGITITDPLRKTTPFKTMKEWLGTKDFTSDLKYNVRGDVNPTRAARDIVNERMAGASRAERRRAVKAIKKNRQPTEFQKAKHPEPVAIGNVKTGKAFSGDAGVWHSMERHNLPMLPGAVSSLDKIHRATGQPVEIATNRIPGASMKAAVGSLRNAGLNKNIPIKATSMGAQAAKNKGKNITDYSKNTTTDFKNKLDYIKKNKITDYAEDKPNELYNLAMNAPEGTRIHTINQPWTHRATIAINKKLKEKGSKRTVYMHPNWNSLERHVLTTSRENK